MHVRVPGGHAHTLTLWNYIDCIKNTTKDDIERMPRTIPRLTIETVFIVNILHCHKKKLSPELLVHLHFSSIYFKMSLSQSVPSSFIFSPCRYTVYDTTQFYHANNHIIAKKGIVSCELLPPTVFVPPLITIDLHLVCFPIQWRSIVM